MFVHEGMEFQRIDSEDNQLVYAARWHNKDDPRGYVPPEGFRAEAALIEVDPISGEKMDESEWFIFLQERN